MAMIDPSAAQTMELASDLMTAKTVIAKQRRVIWSLVAALRASEQQQAAMADLVDSILDADT